MGKRSECFPWSGAGSSGVGLRLGSFTGCCLMKWDERIGVLGLALYNLYSKHVLLGCLSTLLFSTSPHVFSICRSFIHIFTPLQNQSATDVFSEQVEDCSKTQ